MAKSRSYRKRKKRQDVRKWLPWGIAGAVVLLIGIIAGRALLAPTSPGDGPRAEEWLAGVTGQSYDAGPTDYEYPDPAGLGDGRIWLPALGSVDAPVTVIEFSDIFCGHCRNYNLNALSDILTDYVATGEVRYVNHYFGFAQTVQDGVVMAEMCAAEQGRYFEFRHALFQSVEIGAFDIDRAARIAGVETDRFEACRSEQRYANAMQEIVFMQNRGVSATPTFFVNDQPVAGNRPDEIRRLIDEALAAAE
ncbi:MAG: DsbA family protein [Anaerolineae bacterium]